MKSTNRIIIFFILSLLFLNGYLFGANLSSESLHERTLPKKEFFSPKVSWYNNSENPIHIDDTGINNWEWARTQLWCQKGDGSWGNPFIIENITIDASTAPTGSGILINNSLDAYFVIRNCTLTNAQGGVAGYGAGIELQNCSRGIIYNNTCSDTSSLGCGILLEGYNCYNITIERNVVKSIGRHGILTYGGNDIFILYNNVTSCSYMGIYLYDNCHNSTVIGNIASKNQDGIYLYASDNNVIQGNIVYENTDEGIDLNQYCDNNSVLGNIVNNNTGEGIQVYLNSHFNLISGNNASYNDNGVRVGRNSHNNTILKNYLHNNSHAGIYVDPYLGGGCQENKIINNTANSNAQYGIYLSTDCDNNTIMGNNIMHNPDYSIYLFDNENNRIINCTVKESSTGIMVSHSSDFKILNCTLSYLNGINGQNGGTGSPGENGSESYGIRLVNCRNGSVILNYFSEITGGNGGDGGINFRGGDGGSSTGLYCSDSVNLTIKRNTLLRIYGGAGGDGGDAAGGLSGGEGGKGGFAAGLKCINSSNLACSENMISHIYGGDGGTGGDDHDFKVNGGAGGDGALAVGVQHYNSSNLACSKNLISDIYGGDGGYPGFPSSDIGADGSAIGIHLNINCTNNNLTGNWIRTENEYGIFLDNICGYNLISENFIYENHYGIFISSGCHDNQIFYNFLFNHTISNALDNGQNSWDNGDIGNYWDDYSGIDANYDGIGDTPYNVSGGAGNKDYRPIMNYNPFFLIKPADSTHEVGTLGLNIEWIIINILPVTLTFNVLRNGTPIKIGYLFNIFNTITVDIEGLDLGIHGFTIEVSDGIGGTYKDGVWITIINTEPLLTITPIDFSYEVGGVGNNLSWMFSDISIDNPTYTISRNGVPIFIDIPCASDDPIELSVDGLDEGIYGFTIEIDDGYGGIVLDTVWVTVINTGPIFTATPVDFSYDLGSSGNNLTWTFSDISTDNPTYTISRNGMPIFIDISCVSGVPIEISVDGLEAGSYGFTIEINDGYGGIVLDTVWVTVEVIGSVEPPIGTIIIAVASFAGGIGVAVGLPFLLRKIKGLREITK